jgi:hypothetical protein
MKIFATMLVLLLSISSVSAVEIGGGPKIGVNIADLKGDDAGGSEAKWGLNAGAFLNLGINPAVSFQAEILFSQKGARWTGTNPWFGDVEVTAALDYFEFPILLKLSWPVPGRTVPSIMFGTYFATKLSATGTLDIAGVSTSADIDDVESSDYGLVFAAGLDFLVGTGRIVLDGRYSLGLTTVDEAGLDMKNSTWSISVGYSF